MELAFKVNDPVVAASPPRVAPPCTVMADAMTLVVVSFNNPALTVVLPVYPNVSPASVCAPAPNLTTFNTPLPFTKLPVVE